MSRISYLSELLSSVFVRQEQQGAGAGNGSLAELCDALLSQKGEMSGNRLARGLLTRFKEADNAEQLAFFQLLLDRFDINAEHTLRAAQRYSDTRNAKNLAILMDSVQPRRQELFRRLNQVPGATNELVQMRALLLKACKQHPDLKCIDVDFQHLFRSWFNRGFLVLREIDWHSPANILEKIIAYEAVYAISSWSSLRSRLEPGDRRCFAFFHPAMLDEPLIFVEVALTHECPTSIRDVLIKERDVVPEQDATMAVFYSISNCQKGLAGVSFGNFLIKQVAKELSRQLPGLKEFRTLSPVPGFMRWVDKCLAIIEAHSDDALSSVDKTKTPAQSSELPSAVDADVVVELMSLHEELSAAKRVSGLDQVDVDFAEADQLRRLVAYYLVNAKRRDHRPLDPVARFHLGNGASLDAVMPAADRFRKGLSQSASVMVSYLYDLDKVEENHEAYANEQKVIVAASLSQLLNRQRRSRKRA